MQGSQNQSPHRANEPGAMAAEATPQTTTLARSQAVRVGAVPLMPMSTSDAPNT